MNNTSQAVQRVLLITLILNLLVAVGKIIIGVLSGALAITADGFHSIVDGSSNVVALIANRIANRPPDSDHPYGHRRYETLAALGIGAFLLFTAWEIASGVLDRLGGGEAPTLTLLTFAVMIVTLVINIGVNRYEAAAGRRLKSELLLADAAHTGTDIFVTLSVLVSMALVVLFGWVWVDMVAALVVVVLIVRAAWQILSSTGSILVDTAPYSSEQLQTLAESVPSVERVIRARSRGPSDAAYIDIDVQVAPSTTANHSATIAEDIRQKMIANLDGVQEVEVHFVPASDTSASDTEIARVCADALGLPAHEIRMNGAQAIELHVEVPAGQTLASAHELASRLEQGIQARLPHIREVITHIEPAADRSESDAYPGREQAEQIKAQALALLQRNYDDVDWHHLRVYEQDATLGLTLHATLPPQVTIDFAHDLAERAEVLLRGQMPFLHRVTIHTEPQSASSEA